MSRAASRCAVRLSTLALTAACPLCPHLVDLPNELLIAILEHLRSTDLCALSQTCRHLCAVAERVLYSSIVISEHLMECVLSERPQERVCLPMRTLRCCDSLLRRPHLTSIVRQFSIRWQTANAADHSHADSQRMSAVCARISCVLRSLVALERLELLLGPEVDVNVVIRHCRLPALRYCALSAEAPLEVIPSFSAPSSASAPQLVEFLSHVPRLTHLRLHEHLDDHVQAARSHTLLANPLPAGALPVLCAFRGSPAAAAALLPGRPVHYLSLSGQDDDFAVHLARLARTSVPVRYLDLATMAVRPGLLRSVAVYFPVVEGIKIRLALRHTLHYTMSGIRMLHALVSVLVDFKALAYLDLSPTEAETRNCHSVGSTERDNASELCIQWSYVCPTLIRVVFPSHAEYRKINGIWTRLSTRPTRHSK
ncbi:hypothetical protein FISHEDRAFT_34348 [Fistulina hepatica ATCC 64428]|uniref:F-box domain-containing protein n=1 Tax=Fistulina hepatica ATCC 64428 TaxID=1128425 RepID=A0A0D7AQ82_9AGAR|nr:hypothetical protein FISHEDRAFT_34348 [Fistulina hepatica ATCC 64428]